MYKQDYDGLGMQRDIGTDPTRRAWTDFMQPYIKNTQLFICPSANTPHVLWNTQVPTDYAYNFCRCRNTPESLIKWPSEFGVFFDWRYGCIKDDPAGCSNCPLDHGWRATDTPPHNEGINIGYYDGHGKWAKAAWVQERFAQRRLPIYYNTQ